jgi:hypothetical protein
MPEYLGSSNTSWARTIATTTSEHIADTEVSWMKNFQLLALLEAAGRISYNHGGEGFDWDVEYRAHTIQGNTGESPRNFARKNLWKKAILPYRGYSVDDAISNKELASNKGEAAKIKLVDGFVSRLEKSIKHGLGTEAYIDGNATGNETSWHGFFSVFNTNGTTTVTSGAQRSANAADVVGYPDDNYAGIDTDLGAYGGEQGDSVWPLGACDPEFDFFSPLIVNPLSTNAAAFPSATDTWAGAADEVLRYSILQSQRNQSISGGLTNFLLNRESYGAFLNLIDNKEQIRITRGEGTSLVSLGFKNVCEFDGVEVSWEAGVPSTSPATYTNASKPVRGFGFNFNNIELLSMNPTMFSVEGPDYDIDTQMHKYVVSTLSNLKFESPRNLVAIIELA